MSPAFTGSHYDFLLLAFVTILSFSGDVFGLGD